MTKVIVGTRDTSHSPNFGGSTWVRLQYMLGLEKLGLETYWVDRLYTVDPLKEQRTVDYLADRFRRIAEDFGFGHRWCIVYNGGERYFGLDEGEFHRLAAEAELLVNISGHLPPGSPLEQIPRRAYVDVDPGFTQIWAHQVDMDLERHNAFFTTGQNVGRPEFKIPLQGIEWQPILPPVALDQWPRRFDERCTRFTSVMDWRGRQEALFDSEYYGSKREELVRHLRVPWDAGQPIHLALTIGQADFEDLGLLLGHHWYTLDATASAGDPQRYREFIQTSRAEFSVAKSGYVKARSGWVSDRTACYLASGKPAIVQSTGFEWRLPTGNGLLTYETTEEAVTAIGEVNENYLAHCRAARRLAEKYFDASDVLGKLLEAVGLSTAPAAPARRRPYRDRLDLSDAQTPARPS